MSVTGGTDPFVYSLKEEAGNNNEFQINGTEVQARTKIETEDTKSITVIVTDKNGKTKESTAQIIITTEGI